MKKQILRLMSGKVPFCMIQKQDSEEILILEGELRRLSSLDDIPRKSGPAETGIRYDTISMIPFSQIRERGYRAVNEGEKILTLCVESAGEVPVTDLMEVLPEKVTELERPIEFDTTTTEYEEVIRRVIEEEIGNGEGANFVIPRTSRGKIVGFTLENAFSIFRSLVEDDYGTYWKYIFFDGATCFIGSTPERHLYIEDSRVKMNPISGTYRKDKPFKKRIDFKRDLLRFLNDPKEINELFMVVDEELKMMSKMCGKGGAIIGPLLKEMSRLIHSEYLLSGESDKDVMELFKDSMFAATVTGSPVENACNIIMKYSNRSRRYYGSALLLMGRNGKGSDFLDSPITIRTVEIDADGSFNLAVGATLVRNSVPSEEVLETEAKSSALLGSIVNKQRRPPDPPLLAKLVNDDDIYETLQFRNQYLSNFWFFKQETRLRSEFDYSDVKITIIQNEDDFVFMQRHIFQSFGMQVKIIHFSEYDVEKDTGTITLVGPGPGNPNQVDDPKIRRNLSIVKSLLARRRKSLFICLGHQFLCKTLGFPLEKKDVPHQGVQEKIMLFGREERVGFYNTFVPKVRKEYPDYILSVNPGSEELLAIRGEHFIGYQFHPESILTKNGDSIFKESVAYLLGIELYQ